MKHVHLVSERWTDSECPVFRCSDIGGKMSFTCPFRSKVRRPLQLVLKSYGSGNCRFYCSAVII